MTGRLGPTLGMLALLVGPTRGQSTRPPFLLDVNPPGATVGRSEEWLISGRNFEGTERVIVSGPGVEVSRLSIVDGSSARVRVQVANDAPNGYREVRLDGPAGISNPVLIRIDTLRQTAEFDRDGDLSKAQEVEVGSVVVGLLERGDVDLYRIRGTPGRPLTLDLEARRIGTSISPVLTILSLDGVATEQFREPRGGDLDVRLNAVIPPEGSLLVQVRDVVFGGSDRARYRLRVDPNPFASAIFPLGGIRGSNVEVEVSGGSLRAPLRKMVRMPELAGSTVEVGEVDGPEGPTLVPGTLVAGEGPEILEPFNQPAGSAIDLESDQVIVNGRITRPREVDLYRVPVRGGTRFQARVEAAPLGSWLDSVLVVRDEEGLVLAENDDSDPAESTPSHGKQDSSVEFQVQTDGFVTVEVSDRFSDGGPEFGYRLYVGRERPDFSVSLRQGSGKTDPFGIYNLKPGNTGTIRFRILPIARPGPVEVGVEGLPDGISADPVRVRLPGPDQPGKPASPVDDFLRLRVGRDARPGLFEIRVVASAEPRPGQKIVREASTTLDLGTIEGSATPIHRTMTRIPLRVLGPLDSP
ncbi:hypothetical protein P12x_001256 [Tundrisphaera lichenicola]|uniref:hypothetical protein n=1 Tax=Tundrisphaera lichenicola TaxID=2029860 RepID=UPI003EB77222